MLRRGYDEIQVPARRWCDGRAGGMVRRCLMYTGGAALQHWKRTAGMQARRAGCVRHARRKKMARMSPCHETPKRAGMVRHAQGAPPHAARQRRRGRTRASLLLPAREMMI